MNWHYVEQQQQIGPVTDEQLAKLFQTGSINADTLVWREGLPDWIPFRDAKLESNPPPTTAPPLAATTPANADEVVCAECGKIFPAGETIRHGNARVCASCKPVFLQKLAEGARVSTGELNYAGVFTRFAAVLLDGVLLFMVNLAIRLAVGLPLMQGMSEQPSTRLTTQIVLFCISTAIGISYEVLLIGKYGATLGKMACKIKVVTADGGPVSYARALGRYFAKMLSAFTCMIGYLMAFFDSQKRALHDHICNTRVVQK